MKTKMTVEFSDCPIDFNYTIAKVRTVTTPNWIEKFWAKPTKSVREYRSRMGVVWYRLPDFVRVSLDFEQWLEIQYQAYREQKLYVEATEKAVNNSVETV